MSYLLVSVGAGYALILQCFNRALDWLPAWAGPSGKYAADDRHKLRNAVASVFNSAVISCLVVNCLYQHPEIWNDIRNFHTQSADVTVSALVGYYVYDLCDLLAFNKFSSIWPLTVHHLSCLIVLLTTIIFQEQMGLILVSMLFELHAVLLHIRQLLLMHGVSRQSRLFRCYKIVHVFAFVFFRMGSLGYSSYQALINSFSPFVAYTLRPVGGVVIFVNLLLFRRVIYNDFVRVGKSEYGVDILER